MLGIPATQPTAPLTAPDSGRVPLKPMASEPSGRIEVKPAAPARPIAKDNSGRIEVKPAARTESKPNVIAQVVAPAAATPSGPLEDPESWFEEGLTAGKTKAPELPAAPLPPPPTTAKTNAGAALPDPLSDDTPALGLPAVAPRAEPAPARSQRPTVMGMPVSPAAVAAPPTSPQPSTPAPSVAPFAPAPAAPFAPAPTAPFAPAPTAPFASASAAPFASAPAAPSRPPSLSPTAFEPTLLPGSVPSISSPAAPASPVRTAEAPLAPPPVLTSERTGTATIKPPGGSRKLLLGGGIGAAAIVLIVVTVAVVGRGKHEPPPAPAQIAAPAQPAPEAPRPAPTEAAPTAPTPAPPAPAAQPPAPDPEAPTAQRTREPSASSGEPSADGEPGAEPPRRRLLGGKKVVLEGDDQKLTPAPVAVTPAPTPAGEDPAVLARARDAYRRGNQKLFSGDSDGALTQYREAIQIYPGYVAGYRGLGLAYAEQGNADDAVSAFKKYISTVPSAKDVPLIKKRIEHLERSR